MPGFGAAVAGIGAAVLVTPAAAGLAATAALLGLDPVGHGFWASAKAAESSKQANQIAIVQ